MALTVAQIEHALRQTAGNVTAAANELGVHRSTVYRHIQNSTTLQTILEDERESLVDIAESALRRQVLEGNITAIIWTLKASPAAKARGWGERQEVTGANGDAVLIRVDR